LEQHLWHKDFVETAVEITDTPELTAFHPHFIRVFINMEMRKKIFVCTDHGR
jgi:hypothetical protein